MMADWYIVSSVRMRSKLFLPFGRYIFKPWERLRAFPCCPLGKSFSFEIATLRIVDPQYRSCRVSLGNDTPGWGGGGGVTATNDHSIWGERKVSHESSHILSLCFAAKYHNDRLWQVDMKIPRRNVGVPGVGYSAPIRDRNSLWPGGIIPYTVAYSIRKLVPLALNARKQQRTHSWKLLIYLRF